MKVLIDVGDEERKKIALFQILVLVPRSRRIANNNFSDKNNIFVGSAPACISGAWRFEVSESFQHVIRTHTVAFCTKSWKKLAISDCERGLPFFDLNITRKKNLTRSS